VWVLVWLQLVTGMPLEYFQISYHESRTLCERVKQRAGVMVTETNMVLACLDVGTKK